MLRPEWNNDKTLFLLLSRINETSSYRAILYELYKLSTVTYNVGQYKISRFSEEVKRMNSFKPNMDLGTAKEILQNILDSPVSTIYPIIHGEISKVFSFCHLGKEFVVHFNNVGEGFQKEKYVYETFASQGLPIPRIIQIGKVNQLFFSIAEKAPGRTIISYHEKDIKPILPDIVKQFIKINQVELGESYGYGWIQPSGNGIYDNWSDFITSCFQEEQTGFWHDWYKLFEQSFLEYDVFHYLYTHMMSLVNYSPKTRYLLHGDFHLGNMLTNGYTVTGIVDWEMAMYGDFMFDLAAQHIWTPHLDLPQMVRSAFDKEGHTIINFDERLLCALLFKGLDGLRFYAKKGDENAYNSVKSELLKLTKEN